MALATSLIVAALIGVLLGPRMGVARVRLGLWLAGILFATAFTWTLPAGIDQLPARWEFCEVGVLPWPSLLATGLNREVLSNVVLLVPAGAAAALWPVGPKRLAALVAALAVSPMIEFVQLIPQLHRGCQVADVVNNSVGVLAGFALATAVESVVLSMRSIGGPKRSAQGSGWLGWSPPPGSSNPAHVRDAEVAAGVRIRGRDA